MDKFEAIKRGFKYTGMGAEAGSDKWLKTKDKAQKIKETFKGADFRIVDENQRGSWNTVYHYKEIYGNETFMRVRHFHAEREKRYITVSLPELIEQKKRAIQNLEKELKDRTAEYEYIMSLRKQEE